jgi:hypothetical protein
MATVESTKFYPNDAADESTFNSAFSSTKFLSINAAISSAKSSTYSSTVVTSHSAACNFSFEPADFATFWTAFLTT